MRISAQDMSYKEVTEWHVIDAQTQEHITNVVWVDDVTDEISLCTHFEDALALIAGNDSSHVEHVPKVIISIGLKIAWVNCKPPKEDEEESQDETIPELTTESA